MEQKLQISSCVVCDRLLPLAAMYPWLQLAKPEEEHGDRDMNDPLAYYPCRIPALMGRRIRGCFHGWVILSSHPNNVMWFLWNPTTLKTIYLPPLVLKDGDSESIGEYCCLPNPPDDTGSVLLLTRAEKRTFVFCRLDCKRKRLRWTEMSYARQLKSLTGLDDFLKSLTCCNGKVYALNSIALYGYLIQVDIVVKGEEVVITLLPFVKIPNDNSAYSWCDIGAIIKGGTDLYYVEVGVSSKTMKTFTDAHLFRLDMTSMIWEKPKDLINNTLFFIDLAHRCWLFYRPTVSSESRGGYIHVFDKKDKVVSSYNLKDDTVSISRMPCLVPTNHAPLWECRAEEEEEDEADEIVARDDELVDTNSTSLFNISFDVLKMIMELCVGVEYLNFRATCKRCHLAAPMIRWRNKTSLRRLQTYSLLSPWLVVFDTLRGLIVLTDPMFGDKYFMKTPQELIGDVRIRSYGYGYLLVYNLTHMHVMFFNPFTKDIHQLTRTGYMSSICFSAPPSSSDCLVVGFVSKRECFVWINYVNMSPDWYAMLVDFGETVPRSISFPTLYGRDVYALETGGRLDVYKLMEDRSRFWEVVAEAPKGCPSEAECYLVKCDEHRLLLVRVDVYGESVEVFKLNQKTQEWEKLDGLGRLMIFICGATCLSVVAKTTEMENKIYFPRLHSKNGKIVFYSLETCRFHTFSGRKVEEEGLGDFIGTKYIISPHVWIEPSWC